MVCGVALTGFAEATRQRDRFNALLELTELEEQEANEPALANPDPL